MGFDVLGMANILPAEPTKAINPRAKLPIFKKWRRLFIKIPSLRVSSFEVPRPTV
jgi:hypothetical protein